MQVHEFGPGGRVLVEAALDDGEERFGHPVEVRGLVQDLITGHIGAVGVERPRADGREHQQRPQREHVRGGGDLARGGQLFRRHEGRGADDAPGHGEALVVGGPGYAEVDDAGPVLGHQDIARLEVPVYQARPVDVAQRLGEAQPQRAQFPQVQRAVLLDDFGEGGPRHVQRRHPRPVGVRIGVHDGRGERAAHSARRGDLLPEARPELLLLGIRLAYQLDRDLPPRGGDSQIDDTHAARPEPAEQGVPAYGLRVPGTQGRHRRSSFPAPACLTGISVGPAAPETEGHLPRTGVRVPPPRRGAAPRHTDAGGTFLTCSTCPSSGSGARSTRARPASANSLP